MNRWPIDDIIREEDDNVFEYRRGRDYWYISDKGFIEKGSGTETREAERRHSIGNYCRSYLAMLNRIDREEFERILWRASEQNGGPGPYYIIYNAQTKNWESLYVAYCGLVGPSFKTKEDAYEGIRVIKQWLDNKRLSPEDVVSTFWED